ncbi:uncharacterized protein LOC122384226 [Amphibalanus amphitrite]|uniref:uncharacterized protein LOC122384226 n=1 Tax=Amphibalanus amphitrite TaxID=1232801 RepID=UPI001C91D72A|nr:uncharacterized protein LOC122384226 [Amphibalanus amphitrite]
MQQHIMQRFYSAGEKTSGRSGDRKKLKRQSINSVDMDMSDISANSVLCGMQQFDRAVQNMEETILVPSRLMDMSVRDESGDKPARQQVPSLLQSSDAYDVFRLLKTVRSTVRRGGCGLDDQEPEPESKPLQRMPSMMSSQSLSSLSSESSSGGAAADDSGHESEDACGAEEPCEAVRARFEAHLSGLSQCLAQMTEAATFLSSRYEQQLDSGF